MTDRTPGPSGPVTTRDIRAMAEAAVRGRDALARRGHAPDGTKTLRRFPLAEVARHMLGIEPAALAQALRTEPLLPQGRPGAGGQRSFSLAEATRLRRHFARETALRPEGQPAKIVAVSNFKGGVGKTALAAHIAQAAALDGLRVLAIDLDSQGSLTSLFGGRIEDEWQTAFPLIARDFAREMAEAKGAETLDETMAAALKVTADEVIQPTHWPAIDLIGAELNLYWAEVRIPVWRLENRRWPLWDALGRALEADGLTEAYDLILIDTPPALGYLTINALAAADVILVPTGASFLEFESTGRFLDMLTTSFASIEDGENAANRMLGLPETRFEWDALRLIVTRFEPAQQAELAEAMEVCLGQAIAKRRLERTALIGQAAESVNTIYEADPKDFNRDTWARGRATFDGVWEEVRGVLADAWAATAETEREEALDGAA